MSDLEFSQPINVLKSSQAINRIKVFISECYGRVNQKIKEQKKFPRGLAKLLSNNNLKDTLFLDETRCVLLQSWQRFLHEKFLSYYSFLRPSR
jgi:hypothetical protein